VQELDVVMPLCELGCSFVAAQQVVRVVLRDAVLVAGVASIVEVGNVECQTPVRRTIEQVLLISQPNHGRDPCWICLEQRVRALVCDTQRIGLLLLIVGHEIRLCLERVRHGELLR